MDFYRFTLNFNNTTGIVQLSTPDSSNFFVFPNFPAIFRGASAAEFYVTLGPSALAVGFEASGTGSLSLSCVGGSLMVSGTFSPGSVMASWDVQDGNPVRLVSGNLLTTQAMGPPSWGPATEAAKKLTASRPAPEQLAVSKPAIKKPAVKKPAASKPSAKKSAPAARRRS